MPIVFCLIQSNADEIARRAVVVSERTFWILLLTLIVLAIYTFFTYLMQRRVAEQVEAANEQTGELINQRKLSVLPAFIVYFANPRDYNRPKIRNVGNGVALNVQAGAVQLPYEQYRGRYISFRSISHLEPNTETDLLVTYESFGTPEEQNRSGLHQDPRVSQYLNNETYFIDVSFTDIEGRDYHQVLAMIAGKCAPHYVAARTEIVNAA